jgi:DNA-binding XRE family transcriptional regulator
MPRQKITKLSHDEYIIARTELIEKITAGQISIGAAVKGMREVLGMTQTEYGEKVAKVSRKVLSQIENDQGDPKLSTLNACCKAFGVKVGFVIG